MPNLARLEALAPRLLLLLFAALAVSSLAGKSVTGDEVAHLGSGYAYVRTGDFRLNPQHPPLMKMLAGLPLLPLGLEPVEGSPGWHVANEWAFGKDFLTSNTAPMERILLLARLPIVAVGVLLGLFLHRWAREMLGPRPALLVLFLYALCPNFLAHTRYVTTDVGAACFSVGCIAALWRFCRTGRSREAWIGGLLLGLALLAKYSGVVTAAAGAALVALHGPRPLRRRARAFGVVLGAAALVVSLGFGPPFGLAHYVAGFQRIHADVNPFWEGFLWGDYSPAGFHAYYLFAQLWKTPLPALVLFAWAMLRLDLGDPVRRRDWAFVLLPLVAFHLAAALRPASIGVRHVLPAFPFLFLAAGSVAARARGLARVGIGALLVWYAAGTLGIAPHFLPYFNELAGGPAHGIYYLDDSNVEWGEDLPAVKRYVDALGGGPVRLRMFEPVGREPFGLPPDTIKLRDAVWPEPGVTYVAGSNYLQRNSLYNQYPGVRFRWLERYRPVDTIAWSLRVYRFSIDTADAGRADVFYIPREQWYADAIQDLTGYLAASPRFAEARALLASVHASRASWREARGDREGALADRIEAAGLASPTR